MAKRTSDNLITLSLTEAAFILMFAVLVLIGSKIILVSQGEQQCKADLSACSAARNACRDEVAACKAVVAKTTAKPGEIVTAMVNAEELRQKLVDAEEKRVRAERERDAMKAFSKGMPKDVVRVKTAMDLLDGFEAGRGQSLAPEVAKQEGNDAARAAVDLKNCKGQLKNCTNHLGTKGYGFPPCWTEEASGAIQYLFNVELGTSGVKISPAWPPERENDAKGLPGALEVSQRGAMSLEEFQAATTGIFQRSRTADPECRHYVRLTKAVSLRDIDLFNRLRLGVEDHFYKLDLTKVGS